MTTQNAIIFIQGNFKKRNIKEISIDQVKLMRVVKHH